MPAAAVRTSRPCRRDATEALRAAAGSPDHAKTASYKGSAGAKAYRAKQEELIKQGKFKEAQEMDIADVQANFGNKYNDAIEQLREYTEMLSMKFLFNWPFGPP
ncbi:MAG TPA: hypothetical protein VNX02_11160 [Steroidobacteraceae bacterium]|jgi:filamentous hemagglutinin|nr:hypothetical protein [Steroidobacteraceae bacterium]